MSAGAVVNLGTLGMDQGAHLLVKRALRALPTGGSLRVLGDAPALQIHLGAWARAQGHGCTALAGACVLTRGNADQGRWHGAERAGGVDPSQDNAVAAHPSSRWGLAARGAKVEAGGPAFHFPLSDKDVVWTDDAARIYAQAAAAQWDPAVAIDWQAEIAHPEEIEDAVVQVMTYLIENEVAALMVPSRFLTQVHPHFREILQVLAIQAADEARHIEVFTRRAKLRRPELGLSTTGGQVSLKTLLDEPDFAMATFLLSVLGEGSFLELLRFLHRHAPDPITRQVAKLSAQDEARHVAFGMAHLCRHASLDPSLTGRFAQAVQRRHAELQHSAGLNEEVFDALILLAAGSWEPADIAMGWERVQELKASMDHGRQVRLRRLGFEPERAAELSALHTRNFM